MQEEVTDREPRPPLISIRKQKQTYVEQGMRHNRSLNGRIPPLTRMDKLQIRKKVDDEIANYEQDQKTLHDREQFKRFGTMRAHQLNWKNKYRAPSTEKVNVDEQNYLWWNMKELTEELSYDELRSLTDRMNIIKSRVKSYQELKYIQINLVLEVLDERITQYKSMPEDKKTQIAIRQIGVVKALKKNLENELPVGAERGKFKDAKEVLNYTWKLFKDKIDQNVGTLADHHSSRVNFNKDKFNEFKYGT